MWLKPAGLASASGSRGTPFPYDPPVPPDPRAAIDPHLAPAARAWLHEKIGEIAGGDERALFLAFGLAPRKVGRAETPGGPADQLARAALLLAFPADDRGRWLAAFDALADAAEVGELVALYRALPVLPFPDALADRAADGLRTNARSVFEAIAHHSPFPRDRFTDARWNQMILKALFIGSPLAPVVGLRERMNDDLAAMLRDYRAEREAAGRDVPGELAALLEER